MKERHKMEAIDTKQTPEPPENALQCLRCGRQRTVMPATTKTEADPILARLTHSLDCGWVVAEWISELAGGTVAHRWSGPLCNTMGEIHASAKALADATGRKVDVNTLGRD
jgi:hypothetical protein